MAGTWKQSRPEGERGPLVIYNSAFLGCFNRLPSRGMG